MRDRASWEGRLPMIIRSLCCVACRLLLACAAPCRAEQSSGATLVRKCDTYLYGAGGRLASEQAAKEAADCAGFIDAVVAAARLAHEQRGLLPPPGKVDEKAYRAFAKSFRLGVDFCLPSGLATHESGEATPPDGEPQSRVTVDRRIDDPQVCARGIISLHRRFALNDLPVIVLDHTEGPSGRSHRPLGIVTAMA